MTYSTYIEYLVQSALKSPDAGTGSTVFFALVAFGVHFFSVIENFNNINLPKVKEFTEILGEESKASKKHEK